ncbi:MAG TPA: hypothetical protein VJU61_27850 [Polyangiaceae bacterium]|nr:hypothetical protein [Polyangiaceae bacterium]
MRMNTPTWRFLASAGVTAGLACGGGTPPPTPPEAPERTVLAAQRCPGLTASAEALDRANARLFVEVVEVSTRELPQPIGRWLDDHSVSVRSSAHLVAFPGVPTSMPWGQCVDAVCASLKRSITLTAHLPESAAEPFGIALRFDEAAADGASANPKVLFETTLQAMNQEPIVLLPAPELGEGSMIVTVYLLQKHDDLHRVMECQARQAESSKQPRK